MSNSIWGLHIGMMSPDDPQLTSAAQDLWVRSYVEERWRLKGQDPAHLPEVIFQQAWAELQILIAVNIKMLSVLRYMLCAPVRFLMMLLIIITF